MTAQEQERIREAATYLAEQVVGGGVASRMALEKQKKRAAKQYSLNRYVSNSEVIAALEPRKRGALARAREMLRVHPRRSASGIVVVTAFSAPYPCPHGTCVFCPGGPPSGTPQSYLPDSPGMRTALGVAFDPFLQVRRGIAKYEENGHVTDKVETIIEGGTFVALPVDYQNPFVKGVYDGLNGFTSENLEEAQVANESARSRCVGLTLETKPDWCRPNDVDIMLTHGTTRLEIGVQSLRNATLSRNNRGHTVEHTLSAFRVAKDAGLKVTAHMMPGLLGATPEEDLEDLRLLFEREELRPDMMKLYPTLVVPGTALARQFEAGLYRPYDLQTVIELLSDMKRFIPPWHRIMRIQREIPAGEISGGIKNGNLRELVLARAEEKGWKCGCIRCREVALGEHSKMEEDDTLAYREERYSASGGLEVFGSFEYERSGKIAGFVRLRVPSASAHRPEMTGSTVVRELRVYGRQVEVGGRNENAWQHRGLGASLMESAERLSSEEFSAKTVLVTSAVGTRNYYRMLGYDRMGPYMAKKLR